MPPNEQPATVPPTTDFNATDIAKTVNKHDAEFIDVKARIDSIELKIKPEGIAIVLEEASKDSKKLDRLFSSLFCEMFKNDKAVQIAVGDMLKQADRDAVFSIIKMWGGLIGKGLIFILGILVTLGIQLLVASRGI